MTDTAAVDMSVSFGEMLRSDRQNRAPDVLNTIANLSSDEVFTPPEFANKMLDTLADAWAADHEGASMWADSNVTFLDPATKSGVFLREVTKRLVEGQGNPAQGSKERKAVVDRVLTRQVFGIGMTSLTALVARRSIYCSKDATSEHSVAPSSASPDGNIWFERTEHEWIDRKRLRQIDPTSADEVVIELPGTGKCKWCPANEQSYERGVELESHAYALIHTDDPKRLVQEIYGADMHFDVILGNPPYQLGDSGGEAVGSFAMPIYQKFVQAAKALEPRYLTMVTPARWYASGRGLDEFRSEMLSDTHIRNLVDFADSKVVFPGVDIAGGVSYFLWDSSHNGPCEVTNNGAGVQASGSSRFLGDYDVLVRSNAAVSILDKIKDDAQNANLSARVSPIQPFSIRTSYRGKESSLGMKSPVVLFQNGGSAFIERTEIPRNIEWVDQWKVLIGGAIPAGGRADKNGQFYGLIGVRVVPPGTACTETYLVANRFETEIEAERFAAYLQTKFVRFLVALRTNTHHLYSDRFAFVPDIPMTQEWTDAELYAKYHLTNDEAAHIESVIRPYGSSASTPSANENE